MIRYFTPQRITLSDPGQADRAQPAHRQLQVRLAHDAAGRLSLRADGREICGRNIRARRERRVLLPLPSLDGLQHQQSLSLEFNSAGANRI